MFSAPVVDICQDTAVKEHLVTCIPFIAQVPSRPRSEAREHVRLPPAYQLCRQIAVARASPVPRLLGWADLYEMDAA